MSHAVVVVERPSDGADCGDCDLVASHSSRSSVDLSRWRNEVVDGVCDRRRYPRAAG